MTKEIKHNGDNICEHNDLRLNDICDLLASLRKRLNDVEVKHSAVCTDIAARTEADNSGSARANFENMGQDFAKVLLQSKNNTIEVKKLKTEVGKLIELVDCMTDNVTYMSMAIGVLAKKMELDEAIKNDSNN
tara:strand:- start:261 stop:659 length:399 start_codon:yes stop_codon:yes gene_type:complete